MMVARRRRLRKRRSGSESEGLWKAGLIAAVACALFAGGAWIYMEAASANPKIDQATLCPAGGPTGVAAVLIDTTDTLSPVQRLDVLNKLRGLREELPRGWLVAIYPVKSTPEQPPRASLSLCNPGRGEGLGQLTSNPALVEKRWREAFDTPLQDLLGGLVAAGQGTSSPIMETIQSVAVAEFGDPDKKTLPKRLVLVSDMLQYSQKLYPIQRHQGLRRICQDGCLSIAEERSQGRRCGDPLRQQGEPGAAPERGDHIAFWTDFFADEGASISRIVGSSDDLRLARAASCVPAPGLRRGRQVPVRGCLRLGRRPHRRSQDLRCEAVGDQFLHRDMHGRLRRDLPGRPDRPDPGRYRRRQCLLPCAFFTP